MEETRLDMYYIPVSLKKIKSDTVLAFDLYLRGAKNQKYLLYKNKNLKITQDDLEKVQKSSIEFFYIHRKDKKNLRNYVEANIKNILNSQQVPVAKKAEALYESTVNVIEDVFSNPRSGETIKRSKEMIGHTVDFIVNTDKAFANLLKIRKHDFYTYTHSVNVCTFLISLAQQIGITDHKLLLEIGEGGLLHDLGKSMVPSAIINKNSKLTNTEWDIMKSHPTHGVSIAKETRKISEVSLNIIGQHHEKLSGKGYPGGLIDKELSKFARMATIADIYDALTTNRSYSQAKSAMEAGKILMQLKGDLDLEMLRIFIKMLVVEGDSR